MGSIGQISEEQTGSLAEIEEDKQDAKNVSK
jgi:hypothetical protein